MRMLMHVKIANEEFKDAVEEGEAGKTLERIVKEANPEAVYFTEDEGQRAAILVVDLKDASEIPRYAEPWFLAFDADVEFRVAMTMEDLGRAGLDKLGEKWIE